MGIVNEFGKQRIILQIVLFVICFFTFNDFVVVASNFSLIALEENPYGVAIDPSKNIAVVANEKSDSVSIVSLSTQTVIASIPVGNSPRGVAVDAALGIALVSNTKENTVSVINLNSFQLIRNVFVGKSPEGIAINPHTHTAVVTNRKEGTVSLIDLNTYMVSSTIDGGREPIDAAIDPGLNLALIINQKEHAGNDYYVSVIDLAAQSVTGSVRVGKKPSAVAVNPETHLAVVANEKDNSITVINLQSWQTTDIPVGKHPIDVAINPLDNRATVICDEDRTLLLVDLSTNQVVETYALNKKSRGIAINSLTNIAAVTDDKTDSLTLIQLPFSRPPLMITITSPLNGATVVVSPVVVEGTVSIPEASVTVNGVQATVANTTFTGTLPLSDGAYSIVAVALDQYGRTASTSNTLTVNTKGSLTGAVTNKVTGQPLSLAAVSITDSAGTIHSVLTESNGTFNIATLPMGTAHGSITKSGFAPYDFLTTISSGQTTSINAVLEPIDPVISNMQIDNITSTSATITWTTDLPASSIVEYGETSAYGGTVSDDMVTTTHNVTLSGLKPSTIYHLRVKSIAFSGASAFSEETTFRTKGNIALSIISPAEGSTIASPEVMVRGTVSNSFLKETGVVVNGVVAAVTGNEFIANHVPLIEGANTITATATDTAGDGANVSVVINAMAGHYIRTIASPDSGAAPLEIALRVEGSFSVVNPNIAVEGPFPSESLPSTEPNEFRYRLSGAGTYFFTSQATGPEGTMYETTLPVAVLSKEELDILLKDKWEGMKGKLMNKDIEGALSYFTKQSRDEYKEIFEILYLDLPILVGSMGNITMLSTNEGVAEYFIKRFQRGADISYFIYFIKDDDGVWRINSF